jgi:hypothetical protein
MKRKSVRKKVFIFGIRGRLPAFMSAGSDAQQQSPSTPREKTLYREETINAKKRSSTATPLKIVERGEGNLKQ